MIMTAKEIFDINQKNESYWFKEKMKRFENQMKLFSSVFGAEDVNARTQNIQKFSKVEIDYLINLSLPYSVNTE